MADVPEKIRLRRDRRIGLTGILADGRLFFIELQLNFDGQSTTDFVCAYIFDADGNLIQHEIESLGRRGSQYSKAAAQSEKRHLTALGVHKKQDIWVRPFSVTYEGIIFGLVPREVEPGVWVVDCLPGWTLMFVPPWELGQYDT